MRSLLRRLSPILALLLLFTAADISFLAADADAKGGRGGGRGGASRSMSTSGPAKKVNLDKKDSTTRKSDGSFQRGFLGGLLGAGIGGLLFGSMFGMGGSGVGILPFLLLGVAGYFFYRRFMRDRQDPDKG